MTERLEFSTIFAEFKRRLAETLARSRLDYSDEIMTLTAFLTDLHRGPVAPASVRRRWRAWAGSPAGRRGPARLEVTFPFCAQKCLYCFLGTRLPSGPTQLLGYVGQLEAELSYFAGAFADKPMRSLFLGRGTPSLLETKELRRLARAICGRFQFERGAERAIECHPASVDRGKIAMLREEGFNRISFGVESLDPAVLRLVGRGSQDYAMVENAARWSREAGFPDVNLDLVFGLRGESVAGFLDGFKRIAGLGPSSITVCSLTLTQAYSKVAGVQRDGYLRAMEAMIPQAVQGLSRIASDGGYGVEELRADKGIWRFRKAGPAAGNARPEGEGESLLAVGLRARAHIFGKFIYQRRPMKFDPGGRVYNGRALTGREEMAYHILYALNLHSRLENSVFRRLFGRELEEAFPLELSLLEAAGKLKRDKGGFVFLPVNPPERVFYAAAFLLDTLSSSPYSAGRLDRRFLERLEEACRRPGAEAGR